MGVFQNNLMGAAAAAASAGGGDFYTHQIANSFRWTDGAAYLKRTPSSAGNRQTWTFSCWMKASGVNKNADGNVQILGAGTSGNQDTRFRMYFYNSKLSSSSNEANFNISPGVYRDPSAWYHVVWKLTGGTSYQYVNGTLASTYSVSGNVAINNTVEHLLGTLPNEETISKFKGYMAEVVFIDGTALDPTSFAESKNGVWIPSDPSGLTFGSQGYYLDFASASDPGNDVSGNNNDWTNVGLATHDQMLDSPTFNSDSNGGNFATLNPLASLAGITFSEGNLKEVDDNSGWQSAWSTMAAKSGKFYFEAEYTTSARDRGYIGVAQTKDLATYQDTYYAGQTSNSAGWYSANGSVYINASTTGTTLNTYTTNDIVGCAIDIDNGYVYFSKNGTWENSGNPASGASGTGGFSLSGSTSGDPWHLIVSNWGAQFIVNYGQEGTFAGETTAGGNSDTNGYGNFKYTVPSGYSALCTGALPIADAIDPAQTSDAYPSKVFSAITYTGTGSEKAVAVGWQPDLTWVKERSGTNDNKLTDSVRGATKALESNTDAAETTDAQGVKAFTSTGFTLGTDAVYNNNTDTYISWNWKEGADYGLDIVAYSGSLTGTGVVNISHSLGAIPECIWHMSRSALGGAIRHQSLTSANYMMTNAGSSGGGTGWGNSAQIDKSGNGNMTALGTSSTFTTNYTGILNQNGDDAVAYVWRGIEGFSKFGGYTGNANADGTFVYTGFSPAYVIIKRRDGAESYFAMDNKRVGYNVVERVMQLNGGNPESTTDYDALDFLSNGFKLRLSDAGFNGSEQYIYMAWAENPFKYATAR